MPNSTWNSIHAKRVRLTKLDNCGVPITGVDNKSQLVTKGIVKVAYTFEWEEGEDTTVKNGNGEICFQHTDPDQLKYVSTEIQFCGVDPEAFSLITGQPLILDEAGNAVGYKVSSDPIETNFALETWSDVVGSACGGGNKPYGYFLLPFLAAGKLGDVELSVSAAEFTLTAKTSPGTGWGAGPYAVVRDSTGPAPLLEPLTAKDHYLSQLTTVAPPEPTEGAVLLEPVTAPTP